MVSNQQFRLKWNNHRNTVFNEFETLLHNNSFVDCTIGADGKYLKAHKIVLSACSPYLQNVFSEHFDKHPVILLKDVSFKELKCMIDYMYCGEVNISECELPSFLRTAQSLKIKGLAEDINNDYDSTSDSEQQEVGSFSENGRTIEANVEIHDDDGPPAKKSTPSLVSTSVNNSFTGRKRKTPAAGKITSQNKIAPINTSNTRKCADINVPNTVNKTENSDNTLCSTTKENCVKQDETNDNNRKISSQNDTQELVNSRTEVKEELVDTDADNDDNSSYECMNNPCEDSDPLNEDSESNCTNTGNKFSEVSIASLSSYNENGNLSKRISSQNARKKLSEWCEGLTGKITKKNNAYVNSKEKCYENCPKCGKFYVWGSSLNRHLKLECGQEPTCFCHLCKYNTHYPQDFKKHLNRVHKIPYDKNNTHFLIPKNNRN